MGGAGHARLRKRQGHVLLAARAVPARRASEPPQVALVGLGRIVERPVAVNGLLGVRPVLTATLSADHRAADGATGARLLTTLDRLLQHPEEL
ncbi:2-oxo acid dehydrogenase subunit E2 [Streptomyces sp. NPDC085529]|uniref:2-oxo acid dehydrogenase subunit E2 n=1 Tax=Streptomyces sp. NPDC085529 TaxID=3365729 RepID=UPI0037D7DDA2